MRMNVHRMMSNIDFMLTKLRFDIFRFSVKGHLKYHKLSTIRIVSMYYYVNEQQLLCMLNDIYTS